MGFTDKIQKIPSKTRTLGFFAVLGLIAVLFIWQVHIPKTAQIKQLESTVAGLQAKIRENEAKIKKLDELKAEVRALHERLKVLTEQLPPETEVSGLLRQLQNLVNQSGLVLKLWRPEKRRTHASGLYEEIPIILEISGGYHNVGVFFDKVGNLARIVNIMNLKMDGAKMQKSGNVDIKITCIAMTFAALEKKVEVAPTANKAQKAR
jgi:type IV pilus assembly protein PilO